MHNLAQRMNARVLEHRKERKKITYDTAIMTRLVQTQNKIFLDELVKLGLKLELIKNHIDITREMTIRSDQAYAAVKARVDKAKRVEVNRQAVSSSTGTVRGGSSAGGGVAVAIGGSPQFNGSMSPASSNGSASSVRALAGGGVPVPTAAGNGVVGVPAGAVPVANNVSVVSVGQPDVEVVQPPRKVRMCAPLCDPMRVLFAWYSGVLVFCCLSALAF